MATDIVRVFSAARMLAIEAQAIVSAAVVGDDLILTRNNGDELGPFNVRGPQGSQGIQGIQGIQGLKGDKGDKGDQGIQGPAGITDTVALEAALPVKRRATVAVNTNIATLSGTPVMDGYQTVAGDSVLLTGQTSASQNGLYLIPSGGGAWSRHPSADTIAKLSGMSVTVERGALRGGLTFVTKLNAHTGALGATAINFEPPHMAAYPVNSIFIATVATNPNTLLGWGTWSAWGAGRMLVGVDATQTEFNTVEKTGGTKTETLTLAQIPNVTGGFAVHGGEGGSVLWSPSGAFSGSSQISGSYRTSSAPIAAASSMVNVAFNLGGGGGSHNNLSPYITAYMWKRTA